MIEALAARSTCRFGEWSLFGSDKPFYLVVHGPERFEYEHFGVHLGQRDLLTFVGPAGQCVECSFLDCRSGSPTHGQSLQLTCSPDPRTALCIPQGVAHSFCGLENVFTINDYALFLPPLESLVAGSSEWSVENDVVNVPFDVAEAPAFVVNTEPAGALFYDAIENQQLKRSSPEVRRYPIVQDVQVGDRVHRVRFTPAYDTQSSVPPAVGEWLVHPFIASGENSGVIPFGRGPAVLLTSTDDIATVMSAFGWERAGVTFLSHRSASAKLCGVQFTPEPAFELLYEGAQTLRWVDPAGALLVRAAPSQAGRGLDSSEGPNRLVSP